ncbi:MAG TPA: ATP-dependent DNA helicase [Anaeromyxobacteraceae bacterium]|nr:ATP-dependent DNA helicase [Anaeromyxobacteraceae bacterium]
MKAPADPLEAILGRAGTLAGALEGYEHRPDQLAMAREVERALAERRYLVVEAGTGTGKTLAYLVPAALSGRKVVLSTATKALQEQIWLKDLPLLEEKAGVALEAAYLKGRANYYCLARGARFAERPTFQSREEGALWPRIQEWVSVTESGDRAEIDLPDHYPTWRELSATGDTCLGKDCDRYEDCFVTRARARAAEADLVLVNHHLFFADLAMRTSRAGVEVLPAYEAVIFDEAHALVEVATEYFGLMVSSHRIEELSRDVKRALDDRPDLAKLAASAAGELLAAGERFFRRLAQELGASPRAPARRPAAAEGREGDRRIALTERLMAPLGRDQERLDAALEEVRALFAASEGPPLAALARRAGEMRVELAAVTAMQEPSRVYFAETRGRGVFLRAAPVDVAEELVERLYRRVDTVVFTSATLASEGQLGYFRRAVGLAPEFEVAEAILAGPFDFRTQAALVVPGGLPEPAAPAFFAAAAEAVRELVAITEGRAFVLSTSQAGMRALREALDDLEFPLLTQGERPKAKLLDAFRERPSVLFATQSFWEGVDVVGEALSLVVIDKLPFAPPSDPVVAARMRARKAEGRDAFAEIAVPEAALALKQGFGRLIRSRRDRGLVALLDRRILERAYGKAFLATLPPAPLLTSVEAARSWWQARPGAPGDGA